MPTLRTSEFTVLQTVGLDAAVVSWQMLSHFIADKAVVELLQDVIHVVCVVRYTGDGGAYAP
jgi:hypothetical protein